MSKALEIYAANYGHSHEAAVEAVYAIAFNEGVASVTNEPPVPPANVVEPTEGESSGQ